MSENMTPQEVPEVATLAQILGFDSNDAWAKTPGTALTQAVTDAKEAKEAASEAGADAADARSIAADAENTAQTAFDLAVEAKAAAPYVLRLVDVATVCVDRPLENNVEFALFRRSVSFIKRAEGRGGYDSKGWKMCRGTKLGDVNIARQFPPEKKTKTNYYTFRDLNNGALMAKFATKTTNESGQAVLRIYNNKYPYDLYGAAFPDKGLKQATLKLGYCVVKRLVKSGSTWNGRYEILSNLAEFELILPRVFDHKYMADMALDKALTYTYIKPV